MPHFPLIPKRHHASIQKELPQLWPYASKSSTTSSVETQPAIGLKHSEDGESSQWKNVLPTKPFSQNVMLLMPSFMKHQFGTLQEKMPEWKEYLQAYAVSMRNGYNSLPRNDQKLEQRRKYHHEGKEKLEEIQQG